MRTRPIDEYAAIARWYDPVTALFLNGVRARMVRLCLERGFSHVLDIGCGTGLLAREMHKASLNVTGTESSPAMLALAKRRLGDAVPLYEDAYPLPFPENSYDAAVLSLVLHESQEDSRALLAEALRVAPVAVVLEWRMPERNLDLVAQPVVHAIERLAGKEHYASYRRFAEQGYLHGMVGHAGGCVAEETPFLAGTLVLAVVTRKE